MSRDLILLFWVVTPTLFAETTFRCPTTIADWKSSQERMAAELSEDEVPAKVKQCLLDARKLLQSDAGLAACYKNLIDYVSPKPTGKAALGGPKYLEETRKYSTLPDELNQPDLLEAIQNNKVEDAEKALVKINEKRKAKALPALRWIRFESRENSIDGTQGGRFMIFMPWKKEEPGALAGLYNFTLPDRGNETPWQLSAAVTRIDEEGMPRSYLRDMKRNVSKGKVHVEVPAEAPQSGSCVECHVSGGPLAIRPYGIDKKYEADLAAINKWIGSLGPSPSDYDNSQKEIPVGLGDYAPKKHTDSFLKKCVYANGMSGGFSGLSSSLTVDTNRIRKALNCASCHDGTKQSILSTKHYRITRAFVKHGSMPPGANLTRQERDALVGCLYAEYAGLLPKEKKSRSKLEESGTLFAHFVEKSCETTTSAEPEKIRAMPKVEKEHED